METVPWAQRALSTTVQLTPMLKRERQSGTTARPHGSKRKRPRLDYGSSPPSSNTLSSNTSSSNTDTIPKAKSIPTTSTHRSKDPLTTLPPQDALPSPAICPASTTAVSATTSVSAVSATTDVPALSATTSVPSVSLTAEAAAGVETERDGAGDFFEREAVGILSRPLTCRGGVMSPECMFALERSRALRPSLLDLVTPTFTCGRVVLFVWMTEVAAALDLEQRTVHLAMSFVDRALDEDVHMARRHLEQTQTTTRPSTAANPMEIVQPYGCSSPQRKFSFDNYQTLGITCLWLAAKLDVTTITRPSVCRT